MECSQYGLNLDPVNLGAGHEGNIVVHLHSSYFLGGRALRCRLFLGMQANETRKFFIQKLLEENLKRKSVDDYPEFLAIRC